MNKIRKLTKNERLVLCLISGIFICFSIFLWAYFWDIMISTVIGPAPFIVIIGMSISLILIAIKGEIVMNE